MTLTIRAHFDGRFIVPDEPLEIPADQPLTVELRFQENEEPQQSLSDRLQRLSAASGRISGPSLPTEALDRETLTEEPPPIIARDDTQAMRRRYEAEFADCLRVNGIIQVPMVGAMSLDAIKALSED